MRRFRRFLRRRALTLIELTMGIGVLSMLILLGLTFVATNSRQVILNQDRAFAVQKATSMLAELRAVAERPTTLDASTLDAFDDGTGTSNNLTLDGTISGPGHEASGNVWTGARWRYSRRVTIRKFPSLDTRDVRIASVRIFLSDATRPDAVVLADVASVVNTVANAYPPSQVYDTYLLAMENVPGWWVYMAYIRPFVDNALDDLEARQPGLVFRRHWITKSGFGRDLLYQPYFNVAADSLAPINWAYFYPGTMPAGSAVDQYYVPGQVAARINVDGATANGYSGLTNPYPYSIADQFNHCLRAPQESALYAARLGAGLEIAGAPTYRMLLDDMIANPGNYRNAILINLHGELVPFPPVRNFSDPAKDPAGLPNVRVVAHPEKLRLPHAEDLRIRVYGYYEDFTAVGSDTLATPITLFLPGANLTTVGDLAITAHRGGTNVDPADATIDAYAAVTPAPTTPGAGVNANRMYATTAYQGGASPGTLVRLYNTPLRCPLTAAGAAGAGLNATWRLYGNEYIPCCTEVANDFSSTLLTVGDAPKNTARWIVRVVRAALDREFGVAVDRAIAMETRLGLSLATGVAFPVANQPANLSTTYAWRSNSAAFVPFSERYQFSGDPRHCPYRDVKAAHGYNWYFDNFRDAAANRLANWPGFDGARIRNTNGADYDGWHGSGTNGTTADACEVDVPRFMQWLRSANCGANAVYTTLTGFSYYYMGLGNEIGYDSANGFATSIPTDARPFTGVGGSRNEDSITDAQTGGVKLIRENANNYWWSKTWLGELYPDAAWASWSASGNLPSGVGAGRFVRVRRQDLRVSGVAPLARAGSLPSGTTFSDHRTVRRLNARGCTSFFNIGSTAATFRHEYRDGTMGNEDVGGLQLDATYNFPIPLTARISRPFRLDYNVGLGAPDEFSSADYSGVNRNAAASLLAYYNHQDGTPPWYGSALIRLQDPAASNAFVAVNGIDRTVETGSAFIATFSTLTLIHSFLAAGLPGTPSRITQLPQLVITQPNDTVQLINPVAVGLQWSSNWKRWDGLSYTTLYLPTFSENDSVLRYALLYSADNGITWQHILDNSPATPGAPNSGLLLADAVPNGPETFSWNVQAPLFLPEASYLIRIEAYRNGNPTHYSFHQQKIFIDR